MGCELSLRGNLPHLRLRLAWFRVFNCLDSLSDFIISIIILISHRRVHLHAMNAVVCMCAHFGTTDSITRTVTNGAIAVIDCISQIGARPRASKVFDRVSSLK